MGGHAAAPGNAVQLDLLARLLDAAARQAMPLWLGGGWAIDARLGRITRAHEDIDLTFPGERRDEFVELIGALGAVITEETDYGFLADCHGVLLDCEPARWTGSAYELDGTPPGSCPDALEGTLGGLPLRCNSWVAIAWDYLHYAEEQPQSQWPARHVLSYGLVRSALGNAEVERLHALFNASRTD
ncbi:aminoglycoside nucleotidyltransferase ANT(2'')-Ia [Luteimonas yindakuii]|uniref:Aminoglycoside nucleotidyltransferase ANT(2'')-Ia n=1 Tax=Luteimonas yindakuii TaxID=2565782 RepID=A0A4Z1R3G7_9GAMM|nr:aminoglycoside nucleotidyltransferase ANT(2'')-Ia [Luteimonas yindakuii]TKS53085.1 aminoglycoside nucleotidyltransferase ANT(2'')-Ia [Luteimonas yindakuii]